MRASTPPPRSDAVIGRRQGAQVGLASAVAAGVGMLVLLASARLLPLADSTDFQTFWAALFACFGVLSGLSIEVTRSAAAASAAPPRGPRLAVVALVATATCLTVLALSSALWAPFVFPQHTLVFAALLVLGASAYAGHSTLVGSLAGSGRWSTYAATITLESAVRAALVGVALLAGAGLFGMAVGATAAAVTWLAVWLTRPAAREALAARADVAAPALARRIGAALAAQGSSALLVVGFPVLLRLTTDAAEFAAAAPLLLAITLTRAPLLVPLNAYQGVAVAHFVAQRQRGLAAAARPLAAVAGVGALGAGLALLVGSPLLQLLGGPDFVVPGTVLAGLVVAATAIALLTLTGALTQALEQHAWYLAGWLVATATAVALLLTPGTMAGRTLLALTVGPLVGILVHLARATRR
jgi:hypothetical protein